MDILLTYLLNHLRTVRDRLTLARDDGYTTETILVTALVVVLALAVLGVIATKVTAKANSIDLGTP